MANVPYEGRARRARARLERPETRGREVLRPTAGPQLYDPRVDVVLEQLAALIDRVDTLSEVVEVVLEAHNDLVEALTEEPEEGDLPDEALADELRAEEDAAREDEALTNEHVGEAPVDREAQRRALRDAAVAANESAPIEADDDPNAIDDVPEDGISLGHREEGDIA